MKKGIVLFITVALIGILTPLILQSLAQANHTLESVQKEKFFLTRSIILRDVNNALKEKSKNIENSEDLENFFVALPPIISPKGDIYIDISIDPLFDKVNINNLLLQNKQDKYLTQFINNILQKYNLTNSTIYLSLLLDTIDEDKEERSAFSELSLSDSDFRNGSIYNMSHLDYISDAYYEHTRDKSVYDIPWEELVYFGAKDSRYIIDCERVSSETLELLGIKGDLQGGCEEMENNDNKALALALNVEKFSKKKNYFSKVNVEIKRQNESQNFELIYDLKHNAISAMKRVWL